MKLSGYLIEKYNNMADVYTTRRLLSEAPALGIDLAVVGAADTCVRDGAFFNAGRRLGQRDFCFNRCKTGRIKDGLNALCTRSYNGLPGFNRYINKLCQLRDISSAHFERPKYEAATGFADFDGLAARLGLPFVAKGLESGRGCEVFLVKTKEDFDAALGKFPAEKEWIFEEFIRTSAGRDMRIFSIRGKAVAAMERRSEGDFRANVALGGTVRPLDITPEFEAIAADIYAETQQDFLGIDLLYGEEKPYFCEINVVPGLAGIEKVSGENIAKKMLELIRSDAENDKS